MNISNLKKPNQKYTGPAGVLATMIVVLLAGGYHDNAAAGLQGDARWLVEKGDSVYSIARKVFPDDAEKQRRFRKELVENNPDVFNGDMNRMGVGQTLVLPSFATSTAVSTAAPASTAPVAAVQPEKTNPARFTRTAKPTAKSAAEPKQVAPDPEDIVGQVVISIGGMQADNRGTQRALERRSPILKGDTITTAERAYTQIRMKDGALISLRPKTRLRIVDYNFNGTQDGSERSFMELLAGGFRTITGYIGHLNKQNYRVKTTVATIGIRGTHYGLMICEAGSCNDESPDLEDGVYGGVVDGSIVVENQSGISTFNNDQYFHVASLSSRPVEKLVPPPVFHGKAEAQAGRKAPPDAMADADPVLEEQELDEPQQLADRVPAIDQFATGNIGTLVKQVVDDTAPPVLLADQDPDVVSEIGVDIEDSDIIPDTTLPTEVSAPPGAGLLIALNAEGTDTGAIEPIAAGIIAGINGEIKLGTRVEADGTVLNNLPVAAHESSVDGTHDLLLPSGVSGITDNGGNSIGVNWGRWSDNYVLLENSAEVPVAGNLHYIYSDKLTTPAELELAALGGLTVELYQPVGGTTPTNMAGQAVELGFLEVQANFISGQLDHYHVSVIDGATNVEMKAVNVPFDQMHDIQLDPYACEVCTGRAAAAFVGSQAEGMITTYSVEDLIDTGKGGSGAAYLTRDGAIAQ